MVRIYTALTAALVLHCMAAGGTGSSIQLSSWNAQRDDPSEYGQLASLPVRSRLQCVAMATKAGVTVVASSAGTCLLLACRLGRLGCRKCRNAGNASLPLLWMRQIDGTKFCWRTFQRRVDASVDFYRRWSDYVSGFGQGENANFWMGLERLHQLTKNSARRVRWEFSDWNGNWQWSENPNFSVASASDKYRASMGGVDNSSSTADQYPISHRYSPNAKMFSTYDCDNDENLSGSCASEYQAGWWFGRCSFLNPNGRYYTPPTALNTASAPSKGLFFMPPALFPTALDYSMMTFECLLSDTIE